VSRPGAAFTADEQKLFGHLCRQAVVAIENAELHDRLRRQATEDDLTGLANHRRFQELLADEVARTGRTGQPLSLVMLDVDNFKAINDVHGHQRGDAVLQAVGAAVRGVCRSTDEPARYGGEELAVVLPATDLEGAYVLAEELRSAVARLQVLPAGAGPVTVSVGVAALAPGDGPGDLIAAADAALYDAKRAGKDRTVRAQRAPRAPEARRAVPRRPSGRRAPAQGAADPGPFRGLPGLREPLEGDAPLPADAGRVAADRLDAGPLEPEERPLRLPR
jgi:diguanylate cyclase (GGDEF)-like protein